MSPPFIPLSRYTSDKLQYIIWHLHIIISVLVQWDGRHYTDNCETVWTIVVVEVIFVWGFII
jgi:hypothetical protein